MDFSARAPSHVISHETVSLIGQDPLPSVTTSTVPGVREDACRGKSFAEADPSEVSVCGHFPSTARRASRRARDARDRGRKSNACVRTVSGRLGGLMYYLAQYFCNRKKGEGSAIRISSTSIGILKIHILRFPRRCALLELTHAGGVTSREHLGGGVNLRERGRGQSSRGAPGRCLSKTWWHTIARPGAIAFGAYGSADLFLRGLHDGTGRPDIDGSPPGAGFDHGDALAEVSSWSLRGEPLAIASSTGDRKSGDRRLQTLLP